MTYRTCPRCGGEKALRMVGSYEPDTNAGEEIEVDTHLSCACDLTADEWEKVTAHLGREDFTSSADDEAEALLDLRDSRDWLWT